MITTISIGVLILVLVLVVADLIKRNNKNFKKFEKLYTETQSILEKIQEEQRLEREKAQQVAETLATSIKEEFNTLPETPEEELEPAIVEEPTPVEEEETPVEITLAGIQYRRFNINYEDVYFLPCLDGDGLPVHYKMTEDIAKVVRKEFGLPEDNSRLMQYEDIRKFIKLHGVEIVITYPKPDITKTPLDAFPSAETLESWKKKSPEEIVRERNATLAEVVAPGVKKVIRYMDGEKVVAKECESLELYKSYIKKFGGLMAKNIPSGERFIEWYNEAIDDFARMKDVDDV
jgi:hypothetical protein